MPPLVKGKPIIVDFLLNACNKSNMPVSGSSVSVEVIFAALQKLYKLIHITFDLRLPHLKFNYLSVQQAAVLAPQLYYH